MEGATRQDLVLTYSKSADLDVNVNFVLRSLEGEPPELPQDIYVEILLFGDNKPLSIPFASTHKCFIQNSSSYVWNQSFSLPTKYRDLPISAQLAFTVYRPPLKPPFDQRQILGGTTLKLFGKKATLKQGKKRMLVWLGKPADGSVRSDTPSKIVGAAADERGRLEKLIEKQKRKDIPTIDWLDKLAFRQIEKIHAEETRNNPNKLYLYVDLPRFDFPIVYSEHEYTLPTINMDLQTVNGNVTAAANVLHASVIDAHFFSIVDPDTMRDNPVELKHKRLARGHRSGPLDWEAKPDAKNRDELNAILAYPPTQPLSSAQRDLIWRYRFYLSHTSRALTKFLKSVEWADKIEVTQAVEVLLPMWSEVGVDDALELLGKEEWARDARVRRWAVASISKADDDDLMLYLLQLVQALKFEIPKSTTKISTPSRSEQFSSATTVLSDSGSTGIGLEDFLIERSIANPVLGNHFHWYIMVECEDRSKVGRMYGKVANRFMSRMIKMSGGKERLDILKRQSEFILQLSKLAKDLRSSKDPRPKKIDKLKSYIQHNLTQFAGGSIPLPLDASIQMVGVDPEHSSVFKSNLFPLKLHLRTQAIVQADLEEGADDQQMTIDSSYGVIFKNGDDLRQDQLVVQLFTLMDRLLRKENLDLRLIPYHVLATSRIDGMVQFVESKTIGAISAEFGAAGVLAYLRKERPDENSPETYGVKAEVLETFIRSCAGYSVMTYLLGVGDRHLDNLLLSPNGNFFHVDFGYILGRDPKPFPPAVKVCKEMVDGMGGVQSAHYARFQNFAITAFINLRKNANLILNLISLMVDANIPDIRLEPDKAVFKVQDKFMLDLSEEDAINYFRALLNETSSWAAMLDMLHAAAQYWRA